MFRQNKEWETRESAFAAFATGPLTDFWRQREEAEFTGVDNIPVRFVRLPPDMTGLSWFALVELKAM